MYLGTAENEVSSVMLISRRKELRGVSDSCIRIRSYNNW